MQKKKIRLKKLVYLLCLFFNDLFLLYLDLLLMTVPPTTVLICASLNSVNDYISSAHRHV